MKAPGSFVNHYRSLQKKGKENNKEKKTIENKQCVYNMEALKRVSQSWLLICLFCVNPDKYNPKVFRYPTPLQPHMGGTFAELTCSAFTI